MRAPRRNPFQPTESAFQITVAGYLDAFLSPPSVWFHIPNGGRRGKIEAARLKKMGVKAGVPDIEIIAEGGRSHFMELKREKGGRLSDAQIAMRQLLIAVGCPWAEARTLEEVKAALDAWGIPLRAHRLDPVLGAFAASLRSEQAA